ncbi:MAG: CDC27 family protein [Myxococcota bacterium]|nr:CDC27 family protein [Myxococcota bacterium]
MKARWRRPSVMALVMALVVVAAPPGVAQANPWADGITDAQKATAQSALEEGNALFLEKRYAEALAKYQAAIGAWDHPAIRFNMVRCLIQLDRIVDAADNLKVALKYGAAPLEEAVYTEALAYEKLLANQISELAITCAQPGVKVTLDGQPLATCPARALRRVKPGPHQVVGVAAGLLTRTLEVVVVGGSQHQLTLELDSLASAARIEQRWPTWVPWAVFGGGLAIAGLGAALDLGAAGQMANYDRIIDQQCRPAACTQAELAEFDDIRAGAERQSTVGVAIMIAGTATVATGAVMLYLNRGRTVYATSETAAPRFTPTIVPLPGGAAVSLGGSF